MEQKVYPRLNTLVKLRENSFLSASARNELIRAPGTEAIFKALTSAGFFLHAQPKGPEELLQALDAEKQGWMRWARDLEAEENLFLLFSLPDMAHNMRVFLKERVLERDLSGLYLPSDYSREALASLADDPAGAGELDRAAAETIHAALSDYEKNRSILRMDLIVRFFCQKGLLALCRTLREPRIQEVVTAAVDLDLLALMAQGVTPGDITDLAPPEEGLIGPKLGELLAASSNEAGAFLAQTPYGPLWDAAARSGGRELFDALADNFLMEKLRGARLVPFGLYPLYALLQAKDIEIKTVRLIVKAKLAGAEESDIVRRVRDGYAL